MPSKSIKLTALPQRILLILLVLSCLVFVFFATKWFLGNSVANRIVQQEVAEFAISLAPNDPKTHASTGVLYQNSAQLEDVPKSLAEYEKAVALSPNDYRLWMAYGKAKERTGDAAGAEKALLKTLQLAPNYSEVQWVYGNILLRQNKTAEAFAVIRKAVAGNQKYAAPAASIAWDIFDGDISQVKKAVGDSASVKSALAISLAKQQRFDESSEIWNSLSLAERKTTFRTSAEELLNELINNKKYRSAVRLKSQLGDENAKKIAVGKITNGDFEQGITNENKDIFQWTIAAGSQPKIGPNTEQRKGGTKSLALVFNSPRGKDFREVLQVVAVESGKSYRLDLFYKTNLETSATVKWEILDSANGTVLGETTAVEQKSEWQSLGADFKVPENTDGVIIRLVRERCTSADCSISGTVWFDDISLS